MNGVRVIRTIAFDINIGDKYVYHGRECVIREIFWDKQSVAVDTMPEDKELSELPLTKLNTKHQIVTVSFSQLIGENVVRIDDKYLKIGDIPFGQPISTNN